MKMIMKLIGGIAVAFATGLAAFAFVSALHLKDDGASGLLCFLLWVAQFCVIEMIVKSRKAKAKQ
jgi:predicted small integral membrane protein